MFDVLYAMKNEANETAAEDQGKCLRFQIGFPGGCFWVIILGDPNT